MILQSVSYDINTGAENTVVTAVSGKRIRVHRCVMLNVPATAQTVTVKDAASGTTIALLPLPSVVGGGLVLGRGNPCDCPIFETQTSGALIFSLLNATHVNGFIQYELIG